MKQLAARLLKSGWLQLDIADLLQVDNFLNNFIALIALYMNIRQCQWRCLYFKLKGLFVRI
jgi:hypothetical protein